MLRFKIFESYSKNIRAGMTQKEMGSFKEDHHDFEKNVERLGIGQPVLANQTHSDLILEAKEAFSELPEADAFVTHKKDLPLMVKVADCQGVIIYDPKEEALGVVHSGWKGSAKNIIGKTIRRMKELYNSNPSKMLIAISASLGPCCSEFTNPQTELPAFCHPFILDNKHVDFWQLSKKQCMDEGVLESNIEIVGICTKDDPNYFSYRLGDEGRMGVWAVLV